MRQRSSPLSDSSPTQVLHPVLQAAFDSLDVELEEELARYRRQRHWQARHGKHIPAWQPTSQEQSGANRSPQLPLMGQPGSAMEGAMEAMVQSELSGVEQPIEISPRSKLAAASLPPASANSVAFSPDNLSAHPSGHASIMTTFLSEHPERAADKTFDRLRELAIVAASSHQEWNHQEWDNAGVEEIPQAEEQHRSGFSDFSESPDDYLEATEELLQSVAEESPDLRVERESSLLDSLLTPLGIGSMVLLLLSSATLGYVIMHPSSLDLLNPSENTTSDSKAASGTSATPFASPLIPDSPNLAAEEFVDLNVDNLSTIPGNAGSGNAGSGNAASGLQGRSPLPTPPQTSPLPDSNPQQSPSGSSRIAVDHAPAPEAAPIEVEAAPPVPEPEPAAEPAAVSEPESVSAATTPTPAAPPTLPAIDPPAPEAETASPDVATAAAATSPPAGTYYVVTPYNGDPSLDQARQAVPQAYVRNFETGASVQLGVFSSAENAQELVQELESKGIAAEVYQP